MSFGSNGIYVGGKDTFISELSGTWAVKGGVFPQVNICLSSNLSQPIWMMDAVSVTAFSAFAAEMSAAVMQNAGLSQARCTHSKQRPGASRHRHMGHCCARKSAVCSQDAQPRSDYQAARQLRLGPLCRRASMGGPARSPASQSPWASPPSSRPRHRCSGASSHECIDVRGPRQPWIACTHQCPVAGLALASTRDRKLLYVATAGWKCDMVC